MTVVFLCPAAWVPAEDDWLSPAERAAQSQLKIPKRRADFRAGRWAAKQAVSRFLRGSGEGHSPPLSAISIVAAGDGGPVVLGEEGPLAVSVSIAHSGGKALAAASRTGVLLGVDLETIEPRSEAFVEDFFTEAEARWVRSLAPDQKPLGACLLWCVKEAVLKALRTGLREDTRAVEVACPLLFPPVATKEEHGLSWWDIGARLVETGRRLECRVAVTGGQVAVVLSAP